MKSRIKKKITKRLGCRTYLDYRKKLIQKVIDKRIKELGDDTGQIMVHLVLSRKANYKTIHSLKIFTNCYPISVHTPYDHDNGSISIDFNCVAMPVNDKVAETAMNYMKAMANKSFN